MWEDVTNKVYNGCVHLVRIMMKIILIMMMVVMNIDYTNDDDDDDDDNDNDEDEVWGCNKQGV